VLFRCNEELEDRYRGGAEEEVQIWLSSLAANKATSDAEIIVAFMDDCAQRCMRTPERYLDAHDDIRESSLSDERSMSYLLGQSLGSGTNAINRVEC